MKIIFSFDDGHISDIRAAALLQKYGFSGTFYIPSSEVPKTEQLGLDGLKELIDRGMELGGHTVSHFHDLKALDDRKLKFEIENNKLMLEMITNKQVTKFCPPRGRYDERVLKAIKDAGFLESRTTKVLVTDIPEDPYITHTTIHMFPRAEYEGRHWFDIVPEKFTEALLKGDKGMFSVWGHSRELDQRPSDWDFFEELLRRVKEGIT